MKYLLAYLFACVLMLPLRAQYYLRGEIRDEKNEPLANAKITLQSDHLLYYSGSSGGFGISSKLRNDSITIVLDGYEPKTVGVTATGYAEINLKSMLSVANKNRPKRISITKDQQFSSKYTWSISDESYFSLVENETVVTSKYPNTGFSLNVNKASYSNIRRFLHQNSSVPPDAVRTEELLNYFNLNYKEPPKGEHFSIESNLSDCPWNPNARLMYVNINARKIDLEKIPPSNLVFLIDVSGSMDMPNRLPLVKAAFQMLVKNLRPVDTVSIVIYGGAVAVWMQPTSGSQKQKILQSIEELEPGGDTPGESGIRLAYRIAERSFIKGGNNRVILATDGDFNVGEVSEKALEELVNHERQSGVYLTCLGVGMGNFKDSKLEALAKRGNGNYAYLDDIREAEKVLVTEMTQTFYSVAGNAFLNVHFNPRQIKDYRLIGFDNKRDAISDESGELEGGEIGSGNSVLAIFEVTLQEGADQRNDDLAEVQLRYTPTTGKGPQLLNYGCTNNFKAYSALPKELQFGAAVSMFGLKLRMSKYMPSTINWTAIEQLALQSHDPSNYLQREFISLIGVARKIYGDSKSKKRKKKSGDEEEE